MGITRESILDVLKESGKIKRGDILDKLENINSGTIDKEIQRLKDENLIDVETEKGTAHYIISKLGKVTIEARKRKAEKRKADILKNTERINNQLKEEEKEYTEEKAEEDLEVFFSEILFAKITASEKVIVIDLTDIEKFKLELYDLAYDCPEGFLEAARKALENVQTIGDPLEIRIKDSDTKPVPLASVNRSENIYKLVVFEGMISTIDKVRPYTLFVVWECMVCGERISMLTDDDGIIRKPYVCSCGNKQSFEIVNRKNQDRQYITVAEKELTIAPEEVNGYVCSSLVNDIKPHQRKLLSGNVARFYAIARSINPESNRQRKAEAKVVAEIINYEMIEETFEEIKLTDKDIEKIKNFSEKKNILSIFASAIDDTLMGTEYIPLKEAIVLQFFGGSKDKERGHNGNIHVAIIGDPGKGKTTFLLNVVSFAPKAMYAVGTSSTGKGIMACLDTNEVTKNKILRPGPFVRCNRGLIAVDEVDKMDSEDIQYMGEALQNGTFTFAKAGIYAVLDANTSCLLSANPKNFQFDLFSPIPPQINIPANIQDRFDLKFMLWDKPNPETDYDIFYKINEGKKPKKKMDKEFVKKYIAYARSNFNPTIPEDVNCFLSSFYQRFRNPKNRQDTDPITATVRQAYSLKKLSEASAKMRLSDTVSIEDAKHAIKLFEECMMQVGYDKETKKYDNLMLTYGQLKSFIDKQKTVMKTIERLSGKNKGRDVSVQDVMDDMAPYNLDFGVVHNVIEELKKKGDLFEPRTGIVRIV